MNILYYIITFFVLVYLTIKFKHRFWSIQPVFHIYNIFYWMFPPGIIQTKIPKLTKYYDPTIFHKNFNDVSEYEIDNVVELIQRDYLRTPNAEYEPPKSGFTSYFIGHREPCFLSTVEHVKNLFNYKKKQVCQKNTCVSTMTTRPLHIKILSNKNKKQYETLTIGHVDFLCTEKNVRKKGITPKIIYSHYINSRKAKEGCSIFMFKREGPQSIFVPLVIFKSYLFDTRKWRAPKPMHPSIKVIENTPQNLHLVQNFINEQENNGMFKVVIQPELTNIAELCKTSNIFVYSIVQNETIKGVYFFRNAYTKYRLGNPSILLTNKNDKPMDSLEIFASINTFDTSNKPLFYNGFNKAMQMIIKKHSNFTLLLIENISHNNIILDNVFSRYKAYSETNNGYYLYNFAMRPVLSNEVLIIS